MDENTKKIAPFQLILILFISACLFCALPISRNLIVMLMESIMGRTLRDLQKWNAVITHTMAFFISIGLFLYFVLYISKGTLVKESIVKKAKDLFGEKKSLFYLGLIFALYIFSYMTLLRANYDYADDIKRIINGHKAWVGSSRFISESLSVFLHTNFFLNDIAPLPQLLAMAVLSVTSYMLAYIVTEGKISLLSAFAATCAGITPFYFQNLSYKFDSPYMALAMFFGVIPFLFTRHTLSYISISIISLILVCSSYQAGNSIYIVLSLFTAMSMLIKGEKPQAALRFIGISVCCYILALLLFMFFIMVPTDITITERDTSLLSNSIFSTIAENFKNYHKTIFPPNKSIWINFFLALTALLFPFSVYGKASKNKVAITLISLAILGSAYAISYGAYLVIGNALIADRTFMGLDILISLVALFNMQLLNKKGVIRFIAATSIIGLFYGFAICAIVRGNQYYKQNEYQRFRYTILMSDLSRFINPNAHNKALLLGDIGPATSTHMEYDNYGYSSHETSGWAAHLMQYWNMDMEYLDHSSAGELFYEDEEVRKLCESLPLLLSTYYHDIYGANDMYFIRLKNPQVSDYEIK